MTEETLLWVVATSVVPLFGFLVHIGWMIQQIRADTRRLMDMHVEPDRHGFGTGEIGEVIKDNTQALRELSHYVQWAMRNKGDDPPPPPPRQVGNGTGDYS